LKSDSFIFDEQGTENIDAELDCQNQVGLSRLMSRNEGFSGKWTNAYHNQG